jgi:hypothetical protein
MANVRSMNRRAYSFVLLLYPADFRWRFGPEMLEVFDRQIENARHSGGSARVGRVWADVSIEVIRDAVLGRAMSLSFGVPVVAALSSSVLFLLFFWAAGFARHCTK